MTVRPGHELKLAAFPCDLEKDLDPTSIARGTQRFILFLP